MKGMKKYLIIFLILLILLSTGCYKTGLARKIKTTSIPTPSPKVSPTPPPEANLVVNRDLPRNCKNTYTVTLRLYPVGLEDDEIVMVAEKIPEGITLIEGSWSVPYAFKNGNIITWLFAENPPQTLGNQQVTEPIPDEITYEVTGTSSSQFRGKWGLKIANKDALIAGEGSC